MRRVVAAILISVFLVLAGAAPVLAQARDPFRPPGGTGLVSDDGVSAPPSGDGVVPPPGSGGLPRTGQDLVLLSAMAAAFMAAGGAVRLTGRVLAT